MSQRLMTQRQSMRREILKQGYLKKLPNAAKVGATFKRPERRWFVFGVVGVGGDAAPYLEYYENHDKIFSNSPLNMILLDSCRYVIRNDTNTRYTHVFTLVLKDRHLGLMASGRNEMLDWCGALESKLKYLGILQTGDNDYISVPWSRPRPPRQTEFIPPPTTTNTVSRNPGRNPTSPLPPPPSSPLPRPPPPPPPDDPPAEENPAAAPAPAAAAAENHEDDEDADAEPIFDTLSGVRTSIAQQSPSEPPSYTESQEQASASQSSQNASTPQAASATQNSQVASAAQNSQVTSASRNSPTASASQNSPTASASQQDSPIDNGIYENQTIVNQSILRKKKKPPEPESSLSLNTTESSILPLSEPLSETVEPSTEVHSEAQSNQSLPFASAHSEPDLVAALYTAPHRLTSLPIPEPLATPPASPLRTPTSPPPKVGTLKAKMATANLISLDEDLDSDEDTYEPVWDLTSVTRNPQELYSVPKPKPRPISSAAALQTNGADSPPVLPPKTNTRSSNSVLLSGSTPPTTPQRSPLPQSRRSTPSATPPAAMSPPPPHSHPVLPPYSPSYPHSPQVGAEAFPPDTILSPKMREALGLDGSNNSSSNGAVGGADMVGGWNSPPPDTQGAPPPYLPRGALERGANKSLKFSQVEQLEKEMKNSGGVKVMLRRVDCFLTLAFVDCFDAVWIAGWNQQARPFLHNAFHIGDQVVSVNGQVIENARMAHKLIKHCTDSDKITFIIRRVPHARVFAMKRYESGEPLGIVREGGTAEIVYVDPAGVASRHGLPSKAPTIGGDNLCTWWITEINHRALNLFFKDNEIEPRLNAVGKDISIMVQPTDFIKELKRQLKAFKKSPYKDFLLS